jgi:hypothetical protein
MSFGADFSELYTIHLQISSGGWSSLSVDDQGIAYNKTFSSAIYNGIDYDHGHIYGWNGGVADPQTGSIIGTYVEPLNPYPSGIYLLPDSANDRAFLFGETGWSSVVNFSVFEQSSFSELGSVAILGIQGHAPIPPNKYPIFRVQRWGSDGIAFTTAERIFIFKTNFLAARTQTISWLSASGNTSSYGAPVTLSANVYPATADGTVDFEERGNAIATVGVTNGVASFTTLLDVGVHSLVARYRGSASFAPSRSQTLIANVAKGGSAITLASSNNPAFRKQSVSFVANVVPDGATGTITFQEGNTVFGSIQVNGGSATLSAPMLAIGAHLITATYSGDAHYEASSASFYQIVRGNPTQVSISSSQNPGIDTQSVVLTGIVTSPSGAPTGSVQFLDFNAVIGTSLVDANGSASISPLLGAGPHLITAMYSGDQDFASSSSTILSQIITTSTQTATTITLVASPTMLANAIQPKPTASLTAHVAGGGTGTVTFYDRLRTLGSATLNANGVAYMSTSDLRIGTNFVIAVYSGDTNFAASISPTVAVYRSPKPH